MGRFIRPIKQALIPSMSLATRCPNCNTVFQVNEEQLKRYSGVVRCGVCHNPFNGIDHLIGRLSRSAPDSVSAQTENLAPAIITSPEPAPISPDRQGKTFSEDISSSQIESFSEEISEDNENKAENDAIRAQEAALKESFEKQIQSISFDLNLPSLNEGNQGNTTAVDVADKPPASIPDYADVGKKEPFLSTEPEKDDIAPAIMVDEPKNMIGIPSPTEELVKIVQQKKKRSFLSRLLWSIGSLLLLVVLGLQGIYHYSEEITAWWPPAEEMVSTTCELLSCPVKTPVTKPPLSIEADIPEKLENVADQYTQNVTITNNSTDLQIWPPLVMELTDSDNKVLLRRTFQPEEYLPEEAGTAKGLAPASNITFKMTFEFAHNTALKSRIFLLDNP